MQVNLSQGEVELLNQALDAWEKEVGQGAIMGSMLTSMLTCMVSKDERDDLRKDWKRGEEDEKRRVELETRRRRDQATMLRAKLIQSSARASEHEEVQNANH